MSDIKKLITLTESGHFCTETERGRKSNKNSFICWGGNIVKVWIFNLLPLKYLQAWEYVIDFV